MPASPFDKLILAEYAKKYPDWSDVRTEESIENIFGGTFVTVTAKFSNGEPNEELCFVSAKKRVTIFATTAELARFLEERSRANPLLERVFSQSVMAGVIFLLLLIALVTIGFVKPDFPANILNVLTSVVGAAAGFFFGSTRNHGEHRRPGGIDGAR